MSGTLILASDFYRAYPDIFKMDSKSKGKIKKDFVKKLKTFLTKWFEIDEYTALSIAHAVCMKLCNMNMKLNNVWKFKTGIYDYSLMSSVFTPVDVQKEGKREY